MDSNPQHPEDQQPEDQHPEDQHPGERDTEWLLPPTPPADRAVPTPVAGRSRRNVAAAVGLVVGGALVGGIAVSALTVHGDSPVATNLRPAASTAGGFGPGSGRGLDGEQHLRGTLTAVGGSSITVRSASGTATYTVTGTTQVVRDGAEATLDQLEVGDPVLVHVYPSSGGAMLVERVFAGSRPPWGSDRQQPDSGTTT